MEFRDVLLNRRSVRSYQDKPVDPSLVQSLIEGAIQAPSSVNSQPWEFWVVEGRQRVDDLSERAKSWLTAQLPDDASPQKRHLTDPDVSLLYHAPVLVLVVARSFKEQADEDCCLTAGMLMLAARNEGIGSCWIGSARPWFNLATTKKELEIPENFRIVAPLVLGYPKEWLAPQERNPAVVHWPQ